MATTQPAPPDTGTGASTYEQVLEEVSAADPQTFYSQAQRFEQAASALGDTKDLLTKYRRELADAWHNGDKERYNRIDKLIRHIEGVVTAVRNPGYATLLRRIGDTIVDSQQRLRSMKDDVAHAKDASARADLDKRATKILDDLSTSYRQLGGELAELPQRTAAGKTVDSAQARTTAGNGAPPAAARSAVHQGAPHGLAKPGYATARFTTSNSAPLKHLGFGGAQPQQVLNGSATQPDTAVPFSRFAQYAGGPVAVNGWLPGGKSVKSPANRAGGFVQKDTAKPAVLGRSGGTGLDGIAKDSVKENAGKENTVKRYSVGQAKGNDRTGPAGAMSGFAQPDTLESQPALPASGGMPALFSAGPVALPANAAPAAQQATASAGGPQNAVADPAGKAPVQPPAAATASTPPPTQPPPVPPDGAQSKISVHIAGVQPAPAAAVASPAAASAAAPPTPPGYVQVPAQARPVVALGAEHLQGSAFSPGGAPLAMAAAGSATTPSGMSAGSMMHAANPALPAGPHGVLGGTRADGVWLRADTGSWTPVVHVSGRLGRYESTTDNGACGTARYAELGREGR